METKDLFIDMALKAWYIQLARTSELINGFTDEQWWGEIAPGRNRGIYLVGHLIAIHDAMNDILGLGQRLHPELEEAFVKNPDKTGFDMPSIELLKQYWKDVHENLSSQFQKMDADEWFKKHNAVTEELFAKEPTRNKLNVLINRTNHAAFHLGQLRLLKK
jgi:hypothetical protein